MHRLAVLPLVVLLAAAARTPSPVGLTLALDVRWGDETMGPESLREEVVRQVLRELDRSDCYASITRGDKPGGAPADLRYAVTLSDLEVTEHLDMSIAERTSPNQDPSEVQSALLATVEFDVQLELSTLPDELPLRSRSLRQTGSYRPQHSENAQEEARRMVIDDFARLATKFACKQTTKLPQEIERARAAAVD
jgi:hypothetical protein